MGIEHNRAPRRAVEPCEEGQERVPRRTASLLQAKEDQRSGMKRRGGHSNQRLQLQPSAGARIRNPIKAIGVR